MALIFCGHCGNRVSDTAQNCVHCGASLLSEEVLFEPSVVEEPVVWTDIPSDSPVVEEPVVWADIPSDSPVVEAPVVQEEPAPRSPNNGVKFKDLDKKQQKALLEEFWKEDLPARKYQKKKAILEFFQYEMLLCLLIPVLVAVVLYFVFRLRPQSADGLMLIITLAATFLILRIVLLVVFGIILKLTVDSKIKVFTYQKRFQIWAQETRQIVYKPNFDTKVDRQMFEQINIETQRL